MSIRVTDYQTVFADPGYYCGPGPTLIVADDGRLVVSFRRVLSWLAEDYVSHWHPATETCLTHSKDEGRHWSPPTTFLAGHQCPNLLRLRNGRWLHHTHRFELVTDAIEQKIVAQTGGNLSDGRWPGIQRGTCVHLSEDEGVHWSEPTFLDDVPGQPPRHPLLHAPIAVRGNALQLTDGRILISAYHGGETNTCYLFASADEGLSFNYAGVLAEDHNETFLHQTPSGRIVAFMRRWSDSEYLSKCHSDDGGESWSEPVRVCRGYPACASSLPSGKVLLVYGYRFEDGYGTRARCLDAECDQVEEDEVLLRADGAVADLGYPDAAQLPDGRVGIVYYHNRAHQADVPAHCPRYIELCIVEEV